MDNRKKTAGSKMISTTTRTAVAVIESAPKPQICGCGFGYPRIPMGMPQPSTSYVKYIFTPEQHMSISQPILIT